MTTNHIYTFGHHYAQNVVCPFVCLCL